MFLSLEFLMKGLVSYDVINVDVFDKRMGRKAMDLCINGA